MKKASYRVLQWTMLLGASALMATACVVTTDDDGDGGSLFDGGEGGTSTAGKGSSEAGEGGSTTAGTSAGGKGGSTTGGTAGSSAGGSDGGSGGTGSSYVPGLCQVDDPQATSLPSCAPLSTDEMTGGKCKVCMKAKCCVEWQTCFGDTPTTACGWGETEDAPGQFDCIKECYLTALSSNNPPSSPEEGLGDCESMCLNQCADKDDGFALTDTQVLLGCTQDNCLVECFSE